MRVLLLLLTVCVWTCSCEPFLPHIRNVFCEAKLNYLINIIRKITKYIEHSACGNKSARKRDTQ